MLSEQYKANRVIDVDGEKEIMSKVKLKYVRKN